MPCLNSFCCGYSLKSGGSFIGYFSIFIYGILLLLCIIVLWCIKLRIDDAGIGSWSLFYRFSNYIRARSSDNEIEETLQDLKIFSIFFLVYCLFLLFGILCASFLITGAKLRKPGYLSWWLTYQILFIIISAGIVVIFVTIKDERYGLISYFKNFFFKILIIAFVVIYLTFVALLIYFWISVLSLHTYLKREKKRRKDSSGAIFVDSTAGILNENFQGDSNNNNNGDDNNNNNNASSSNELAPRRSNSIQMIPITLSKRDMKDNGKIFIIRV
ncbi:unnamed protein product [Chironomus riparius]|uniref:Uncharacterized protein n=1 Tax=Chironomus riparius TaxID=315576 RepID=A0A9N9WM08_9DIPT|nr:unnamed protein product [Chironomus riparius]